MNLKEEQILDYGNCDFVRNRGKEAYIKDVSPRTETWYKADGMGELAPHSEALGSVPEVNHGVVHRNSAFLPGEASFGGLERREGPNLGRGFNQQYPASNRAVIAEENRVHRSA